MNIEIMNQNNTTIAVIVGNDKVITDTGSALDLAVSVKYEANTNKIAIDKKLVADEFFILSTGLAGEILQKFINYGIKMAFYGDYSHYTSKPLKDFIYESNKGENFFFVETKEEAVEKLSKVK